MSPRPSFTERLASGAPVLMDGAMNTELSRKGYVFNTSAWLRVNLDRPEAIAAIHAGYARAGAEVHIANSFATARHALEADGLAADFEALNRAAVTICREAAEGAAPHPQWIAGSVSTFAKDHDRNNLPRAAKLEATCAEQADQLAGAGCDMIALEMLLDVKQSIAMMRGAARCGLPLSLGLVCARNAAGELVLEGARSSLRQMTDTLLAEAVPRLLDAVPTDARLIVTVMHSEVEETGPALDLIRRHWDGDIAAYPNRGRYLPPGGWDNDQGCTPAAFADSSLGWIAAGARMVGGCCGVGPAHIREFRRRLDSRSDC